MQSLALIARCMIGHPTLLCWCEGDVRGCAHRGWVGGWVCRRCGRSVGRWVQLETGRRAAGRAEQGTSAAALLQLVLLCLGDAQVYTIFCILLVLLWGCRVV